MSSLRRRLFVLLMVATGAIWLCAVGWIYMSVSKAYRRGDAPAADASGPIKVVAR